MQNGQLVYITYPILLIILIWGARLSKKKSGITSKDRGWNEEFMSLQQMKYLQGFFAICIMLHHIGQETCASWQSYPLIPGLEFFVPIGYFFVAFFLFCSGYGLFKSYKEKKNYLKGYCRRRILPLIVAFYSTGWIFLIARILMGEKMDKWKYFCYISGWQLSNPYSWYVIAVPFFYLFFYLSFRLFKKDGMKIAGVIVCIFFYTFVGTWVDHNDYWMRGEWWYNTAHMFWIGILFARFEKNIIPKIKKRYFLCLALALFGTIFWFRISQVATDVVSYYGEYNRSLSHIQVVQRRWICLLTEMLACASFVFSALFLNMKIRFGNALLKFMGNITLEFYLIHGLILELFSYKFCDIVPSIMRIKNVPLLILVVFIPSLILSVILQKIHNGILRFKR